LHPWCVVCAELNIRTAATEVHHVGGYNNDQEFFDQSRWKGLCKKHHSPYLDDDIPDNRAYRKNLIIVFGPPCAGKSHYINEIIKDNEIIICRDLIATELTGEKLHGAPPGMYRQIDAIYTQRILGAINSGVRAYIPATKIHKLKKYLRSVKMFRLLVPSRIQCMRYMQSDDTRINKDEWITIIDRWFRWWSLSGAAEVKEIINGNKVKSEVVAGGFL